MLPPTVPTPPCSTLFPYTTLFRSDVSRRNDGARDRPAPSGAAVHPAEHRPRRDVHRRGECGGAGYRRLDRLPDDSGSRSEEHTSELQSLRHLVCRLLLEKQKKSMT